MHETKNAYLIVLKISLGSHDSNVMVDNYCRFSCIFLFCFLWVLSLQPDKVVLGSEVLSCFLGTC